MMNLEYIIVSPVDISILDEKGAGSIVNIFINPKASVVFEFLGYSIYGPGPSIVMCISQEDLFCRRFVIWVGGYMLSGSCCNPLPIHEVWISLGVS